MIHAGNGPAQNQLGCALADRCQTPVVEEVYNKSLIDWVSGQYGETLHSCAVYSLAFSSGKYFCTLVQYLAILTTNPVNKIYILTKVWMYEYEHNVAEKGTFWWLDFVREKMGPSL